jgi:hypothetical protein
MNSFVKSLLNVILRGSSTPSCLLNTISRNVPSCDNLCMSCEWRPLMYAWPNIGEWCGGVTAVKDKIYIGGDNKVIILNIDGSLVRKIATTGINYNLLYNERNDQLLLRQGGRLCCINLDGHVIYRYDISGGEGLAVDQQGHVYISGRHSLSCCSLYC